MQSGPTQDALVITTERVDDIPLLIGVMQQMGNVPIDSVVFSS